MLIKTASLCALVFLTPIVGFLSAANPNIIFILADDMGVGDVDVLSERCKIKTPHLDQLASEGMAFTDAHSSSSVCTPTRYAIVTGRYNWRSRLQSGVCWGWSRRLIEPDRITVGNFLQKNGYRTAAIGKWHMGMNWPLKRGGYADDGDTFVKDFADAYEVDYLKPVKQGPTTVGFDYFFGISASLDMPPYVFIRNDKPLVTKIVTKGFPRKGPADVDFEDVDVLPRITEEAVKFIGDNAARSKAGKPFFVYFPLNAPHTPISPTKEFLGKSGLNKYGDFTMQVDWTVGQVMKALDRTGLADNTLLIFTTDNGCSPQAKFAELAAKGHFPSDVYRGHKADIFEGGHRVPFIARWPGKVKAGTISSQTICQSDLFATAAAIIEQRVPKNAAEDSVSFLPALLGRDKNPLREATVHHSINGTFSIRQGKWKLALCPGSGGWSSPRPGRSDFSEMPVLQLFDLDADIGETKNVQARHPQVVAKLSQLLQSYVDRGRSTPGPKRKNTATVDIWKAGRESHAAEPPRKKGNRK
ncbi:MAG: arylsulfatase A [Limisphaerales bacterium]|jgi:arylsulfatase A